jgi:hypothetical protein
MLRDAVGQELGRIPQPERERYLRRMYLGRTQCGRMLLSIEGKFIGHRGVAIGFLPRFLSLAYLHRAEIAADVVAPSPMLTSGRACCKRLSQVSATQSPGTRMGNSITTVSTVVSIYSL